MDAGSDRSRRRKRRTRRVRHRPDRRRGYLTDVSRTYLCGDRRATDEQRRLYQAAYAYLHDSVPEFRPGASFEELGHKLGSRLPNEFHPLRYPFIAHGSGLIDEYPCVKFDNTTKARSRPAWS